MRELEQVRPLRRCKVFDNWNKPLLRAREASHIDTVMRPMKEEDEGVACAHAEKSRKTIVRIVCH